MHPVLCAAARRDLQKSLGLHQPMDHGAVTLEYHTLNRRPVRGSSIEIQHDQETKLTRGRGPGGGRESRKTTSLEIA